MKNLSRSHITSRGNERKHDGDRKLFLDTLARVNKRFHWICHPYCLMDITITLVIETPDGNLSKGMRQRNGIYTQAYNKRHGRVGYSRKELLIKQREIN